MALATPDWRLCRTVIFNQGTDDYLLTIREAILTGKDIDKMVFMQKHEEAHGKLLDNLGQAKNFGAWRHTIFITWVPDKLVAEVMLYGSSSPMVVILSSEDCRDFGEMDGYVCDWENQREMRFLDYLAEITCDEGESREWK